ncbi:MAG: hypothetical protein LC777_17025 [Actinobacteria bacterium]|nr:hypothetical protein [Actinomycetota bacterium]
MTVYTVATRAGNGAAAPWPTAASAFAIVAVPQILAPSTSFVVRGKWLPGVLGDPDPDVAVPHVGAASRTQAVAGTSLSAEVRTL